MTDDELDPVIHVPARLRIVVEDADISCLLTQQPMVAGMPAYSGKVICLDLEIDFTIHGTAVNGVDYAAMPSFVVLPAGTASTTVSVAPLRASAPDPEIGTGLPPPKTVRLSLVSSPTQQYLLGPSYQAVVTFSP